MKKANRKLRRKAGTLAKKQRRQERIGSQAATAKLSLWAWLKQWHQAALKKAA